MEKFGRTGQATDDLWRMRDAYWIPKVTNRLSEYAFPLQQWLNERASKLHYTYSTLSLLLYFNAVSLMMTFQHVGKCCQRECKEMPTNKELCTRGQQCHLSIY